MSTALVSVAEKFPVLVPGSTAAEVIRANLAGEEVNVGDLSRIKVPAGGATSWSVVDLDGEKAVKELEGIIIHVTRRRAYWDSTDPSGAPPDCSSTDCVTGVGTPGGDCQSCPLNQFGSSRRSNGAPGRGKACKESALLFLLRAGSTMPDVVIVPPGSLKTVRQYRTRLPLPYFACVTRLKLAKIKNKDGIDYAQVTPEYVGPLEPTAVDQVRQYAATLRGMFESVNVDRAEIDGDE